jgi:acetyltransferase-like isoleucine patch superfamily enzyme
LKKYILNTIWYTGRFWSYLYSYTLNKNIDRISNKLYSAWLSKEFKSLGHNSVITRKIHLLGAKYIAIGNNSNIGIRATLTAWDKFELYTFCPEITIGSNVSIGDDSHITAINKINIGDNVLMGKKVTITDNSHGKIDIESLLLSPLNRCWYSEGPVIIEDNVWIGDKATILPNVRIGKNAIIGANAVVTKDIPANCVAVGIPAKVIKIITNS